ncbi:MAG: L-fucose/L-arabinose isomerase family protein [Promethearchaeota archaeon]
MRDPKRGLRRTVREHLKFAIVVGNRDQFPSHLASDGRKKMIEVLQELGHEVVVLPEDQGTGGTVQTQADARECAALFKRHADEIDGIVVTLPNFGDEKAAANAIRWSGLDVPVLVHAEPDDPTRMSRPERRDAYCGKISLCSALVQYDVPFTLTSRHVVSVVDPAFREEVDFFAGVCRVVNGLRGARIGQVGTRPGPFVTVRYSEKLLEAAGVSVEVIDLSDLLAKIEALDGERVRARLEGLKEQLGVGADPGRAPCFNEENLARMAKLALALEDWIVETELDAVAFQCWTAVEESLGVVPCAALSALSSAMVPAACEADVTGALSMLALQLAANFPAALLDWNNNYGDDPDKCVLFHCSNLPVEFFDQPKLGAHAILRDLVGLENVCGTISGRIPPGDFTFARVTTDDINGEMAFYVGEGVFTDDPLETFGGYGVAEIPGLEELLEDVCQGGFEHHVAVTLRCVGRVLEEAFSNYLGFAG